MTASRTIRTCISTGIISLCLAVAGCGSGSLSDEEITEMILNFTEQITGSILVVPIQNDLDVDYGFGLYSTILFSGSDTQRNSLFLRALTRTIPRVKLKDIPTRSDRARRNAFFLPTNINFMNLCIPEGGDRFFEVLASRPETQIDFYTLVYGHDLAEQWLNSLQDRGLRYGEGPVLVVSPAPIGKIVNGETLVIVIDLSGKSDRLFEEYIDLILEKIRKPETWQQEQVEGLSLGLAEYAVEIDDAIASAAQVVGRFISVVRAAQAGNVPESQSEGLRENAKGACERLKAVLPAAE